MYQTSIKISLGQLFFERYPEFKSLALASRIVLCWCACLAISCTTAHHPVNMSLEHALAKRSSLQIPYELSSQGLMVIEAEMSGLGIGKFILDTGATGSGVFLQALPEDVRIEQKGRDVRLHGISKTEMRQTVELPFIKLGSAEFKDIQLVLINQPKHDDVLLSQTIGVIGLDVLSPYKLLIDPLAQNLTLIDEAAVPLRLEKGWTQMSLTEEPHNVPAYGLHFIELKVNSRRTFALLDTGAEYNVMNWNFKHMWQLTLRRRSLKREWEHNGALGRFEPVGLATIEDIRSGGHTWPIQTFSVFDLSTFDAIGLNNQPLMIAGMPFFKNQTLLIDFPNNILWFKSRNESSHGSETRYLEISPPKRDDINSPQLNYDE